MQQRWRQTQINAYIIYNVNKNHRIIATVRRTFIMITEKTIHDRRLGGIDIAIPWQDGYPKNPLYSPYSPDRVYIPLTQERGNQCLALVRPGDKVKRGQQIGISGRKIGSQVHASVTGDVVGIAALPMADGPDSPVIVIENDGSDAFLPLSGNAGGSGLAGLWEMMRLAGIVGTGGTMVAGAAKTDSASRDIDVCIFNGAECEPFIRADEALMLCRAEEILSGCRAIMQAAKAKKGYVAIETGQPEALKTMQQTFAGEDAIKIVEVPRRYPMGGEEQLVYLLTGREYKHKQSPAARGVLVYSVATAAAVADAVHQAMPLIRRIATVAGDVRKPQNVLFPIGTLVEDLIAFCGGPIGLASKVIMGGPMHGRYLTRLDTPITKTANALIVFNEEHDDPADEEYPCIHCNRCVDACPMRLMPLFIDRYYRQGNWTGIQRLHAESCIDCGCCSYVCPSRIPLARNIVAAGTALERSGELVR